MTIPPGLVAPPGARRSVQGIGSGALGAGIAAFRSAVDDRTGRHLDHLRRRHRELGTAVVLHADDAPGAAREVDPRVEALAAVAAHDLGGAVGA